MALFGAQCLAPPTGLEPEHQHSEVQWRSCAVFGSRDFNRAVPLAATARYPASIVVMSLFIAYQIYRYTYTHGIGLILLTLFDLILIGLV